MILLKILGISLIIGVFAGIAAGLYTVFRSILSESSANVTDYLKDMRLRRSAKYKTTKNMIEIKQANYLGISFSKKSVYEQDFYLDMPTSTKRLIAEERKFAPELKAAQWAPHIITVALKNFF